MTDLEETSTPLTETTTLLQSQSCQCPKGGEVTVDLASVEDDSTEEERPFGT